MISLAEQAKSVPGDMVECGVCNGGSAAIIAHFAAQTDKNTWLFDSFEGLPAPTEKDLASPSGEEAIDCTGDKCVCVGNLDSVREVLNLAGANMNKVKIIKGWFQDTFPTVDIPKIAMLNLDSDWYESEMLCLNKFYDSVSIGGFIYFDDFNWWPGSRQATLDFFRAREISPKFNFVQNCAWIQKE